MNTKWTGPGSLFKVSADEYGDPELWYVLAEANKIDSPRVADMARLIIPDAARIRRRSA